MLSNIPEIEVGQFVLRGMELDDAPDMFEFMSDRETMKYITPNPVKNVEEMKEYILSCIDRFKREKEIPWVIVDKKTNRLIGVFRLHKLHFWHKKAEMGVVIHKDFQQKRVMTEVLNEMIPYTFNVLGLNRLVGDIFANNVGSKKLLEKYGFHRDGVLRQTDFDGTNFHDTVVYSMLKDEFEELYKEKKGQEIRY
ncbi:GNAT family N-acetyltransferase [Bacillus sp. 31A1R]|uniref:GNAT family N-acetyltransferase n=1 Tax=Robertmurraya mangrovi TaxID=3098077 RepID=A0ABU5IWS3_9BACI|nr:GNAT family N-acetyltransferase [Bacillus sp. 31A1R]MDZ5471594.1 GNAT family N-acetyltransferase [Bacillus sp. 31A1R]